MATTTIDEADLAALHQELADAAREIERLRARIEELELQAKADAAHDEWLADTKE